MRVRACVCAAPLDEKYSWEDTERLGPTGDVVKGTLLAALVPVIRKRTQFLQSGQGVPYHVVREVSILKGINHPHIVRLLDVIHEFDSVSLIYECLPRDLRSILDEKSAEYMPGPAIDPLQLKDYYRLVSRRHLHRLSPRPFLDWVGVWLAGVSQPAGPLLRDLIQ